MTDLPGPGTPGAPSPAARPPARFSAAPGASRLLYRSWHGSLYGSAGRNRGGGAAAILERFRGWCSEGNQPDASARVRGITLADASGWWQARTFLENASAVAHNGRQFGQVFTPRPQPTNNPP